MKKIMAVLLLVSVATASAATFTMTLTTAQVNAVTRAFNARNAALAAQTPPGTPIASAQAYGAILFTDCIDQVTVGLDARVVEDSCRSWKNATQGQRDAATAALPGLVNPCR